MNTVCQLNKCTGCRACVDICPKNAIVIKDSLDAYNAEIDGTKCINCNLCHNICQNNNEIKLAKPVKWYQGWAEDENIRNGGSSGGAASALMLAFVESGGYICSCTFKDGQFDFITVNQQVQQVNPATMQTITRTLNDLSAGEFDIVIADTPATATQRTAQFWSLVDACGKLGINGNMVLDILLDLSDVPQKEEIKRRLQQQQQQQAQAQQQQMQMQLEIEKQKKLSRSMAYKDLQLPLQLQLAAEAGIFPKQYADAFMQWSIQQYAAALGIPGAGMQQPQAQIPPQLAGRQLMQGGIGAPQPQQPMPQAQRPLTQAALSGLAESGQPVL